ncbi:SAC3 domain-containing protein 1 [Bombina bombina]|uniref:SAC3 domain-containing protein 1 n=1 Tax=Bombina bombina TaxID=8345 RepID=UPI00235A6565|nr:SAC3 domain-containing protein 1 [Bombina bombina]XP_053576110.1 SAC3 domain-containing protein 1 [Bombina bombina]
MDHSPPPPTGICLDMCPEQEIRLREQQGRLHRFETANVVNAKKVRGGYLHVADPKKAVKEYSRPAAGKELSCPRDLRTPNTLLKTVQYLIMDVFEYAKDRGPRMLAEAYSFVFDRLRSVRQDLIVQRVRGKLGAQILEGSLGFLLCAPYLVRELAIEWYDEVLHAVQVRETFSDLMECYQEGGSYPRQAEFQALLLLYDLGNLDAMHRAMTLPRGVGDSPHVNLALAISRAHLESNWVRLFRLVHRLNCLQACAFYGHVPIIRHRALHVLNQAYSSKKLLFPLDNLAKQIGANGPEVVADMCKRRGLTLDPGGKHVMFFKASFIGVGSESPGREVLLVEQKRREWSWAEIMMGEEEAG